MTDEAVRSAAGKSPMLRRAARRYEGTTLREIKIPEWLDEDELPEVMFVTPINVTEMQKYIFETREIGALLAAVELIIRKAKDHNGEQLFGHEDRILFRREIPPSQVEAIAGRILDSQFISLDDAKKN